MILSIVFLLASVILANVVGKTIVVTAAIFIYAVLTAVFYLRVKALARKR